MKILCVIDMQPFFPASKKIIANVIKQIKKAIKNNQYIYLITYDVSSWTPPHDKIICEEISETIDLYKKCFVLTKSEDSAANVILEDLKNHHKIKEKYILNVCGVNLEGCIYATLKGLSVVENVKVRLLTNSCAGEQDPNFSLEKISKLKNVKLI